MAFGVAFGILAFDAENTQREKCDQSFEVIPNDNRCLGVKWSLVKACL